MVVGGYGGHVLSDVWLLDVSTGLWSEVHVLYVHVHANMGDQPIMNYLIKQSLCEHI